MDQKMGEGHIAVRLALDSIAFGPQCRQVTGFETPCLPVVAGGILSPMPD